MTATGTTNGNANPTVQEPKKFLLDPYREWATGEGIPIHLDFGPRSDRAGNRPVGALRRARLLRPHPRRSATSWPIM